jgi:hypothetical protein
METPVSRPHGVDQVTLGAEVFSATPLGPTADYPVLAQVLIKRTCGKACRAMHPRCGIAFRIQPCLFIECSCVSPSSSLSSHDRLGRAWLPYGRSAAIAERHNSLLGLIERGSGSAITLARTLGVSEATINRDLNYLRSKGHAIRARRLDTGWAYDLEASRGAKAVTSEKRS